MKIVSKQHALSSYQWGNNCMAWSFVEEPFLQVKLEVMPPGTSEELHFHNKATQFFFILKGQASFDIEGNIILINTGEGIDIKPNQKHRVFNTSANELEFLITSQPAVLNDRFPG